MNTQITSDQLAEQGVTVYTTLCGGDTIEPGRGSGVWVTDHRGVVKMHITEAAIDDIIAARTARLLREDSDLDPKLRLRMKR